MTINLFVLLILAVFASEDKNDGKNGAEYAEKNEDSENNVIIVKIEEGECAKKISKFIGVNYDKKNSKWRVRRWNKIRKRDVSYGSYDDEETAAHASDTLAKKIMQNGGHNYKLNFPDNHTEVYREKSSKFIGVCYVKDNLKWKVQRWSSNDNTMFCGGYYDDEETAALASDTLARTLMENGKQNHKLNFPDEYIEVYPEQKSCKFIGVNYDKIKSKWRVQRWSKHENKDVYYGRYDDEETAAHASDTLGRKLMATGEQKLKLNFPDDYTEIYPKNQRKKRKRPKPFGLEHPQNN